MPFVADAGVGRVRAKCFDGLRLFRGSAEEDAVAMAGEFELLGQQRTGLVVPFHISARRHDAVAPAVGDLEAIDIAGLQAERIGVGHLARAVGEGAGLVEHQAGSVAQQEAVVRGIVVLLDLNRDVALHVDERVEGSADGLPLAGSAVDRGHRNLVFVAAVILRLQPIDGQGYVSARLSGDAAVPRGLSGLFVERNVEGGGTDFLVAEVEQVGLHEVEPPVAGGHHLVGAQFEGEGQGEVVRHGLVVQAVHHRVVVGCHDAREFHIFRHDGLTAIVGGQHVVVMALEVGAGLDGAELFAPYGRHIVAQHAVVVVGQLLVTAARLVADKMVLREGYGEPQRARLAGIALHVDAQGAVGSGVAALHPEVDGGGGVGLLACLWHPHAAVHNHARAIDVAPVDHARREGIGAIEFGNGLTGIRAVVGQRASLRVGVVAGMDRDGMHQVGLCQHDVFDHDIAIGAVAAQDACEILDEGMAGFGSRRDVPRAGIRTAVGGIDNLMCLVGDEGDEFELAIVGVGVLVRRGHHVFVMALEVTAHRQLSELFAPDGCQIVAQHVVVRIFVGHQSACLRAEDGVLG